MNFSTHDGVDLYAAMLNGTKTQTRRPYTPGDTLVDGVVYDTRGRVRFRVGRWEAICSGRDKCNGGRREVVAIRQDFVRDISAADAIAEGFDGRDVFLQAWQEIYGPGSLGWDCWVLEFAPGPAVQEVKQ